MGTMWTLPLFPWGLGASARCAQEEPCELAKAKAYAEVTCVRILVTSRLFRTRHTDVKTIVKFAQFEYKYGDVERGRTIFEGIMNNYPKRVDLWSVYLDMEMRTKEVTMVRYEDDDGYSACLFAYSLPLLTYYSRLFERIIHMKFSSKKSRFFFKRFLEFEKQHGDDAQVQHVIDKARAYVQSLTQETAPVGH